MAERLKKPEWLKIRLSDSIRYAQTQQVIESHCLNTICVSGRCPNQSECWSRGTATFMIQGDICTRNCRFCHTKTGKPEPLDVKEPQIVADSIKLMHLRHVVITSVTRDDLPDLGAAHWAETILAVRHTNPETTIEVLIPDFQGRRNLINEVIEAAPDIISHNMETVRRLTPEVRSAATYERSLAVLQQVAASGIIAKSGLMAGLGESETEVLETMDDLRKAGCTMLTLGQYLQPSRRQTEVKEYVSPEQFARYKIIALEKNFTHVESGPLVRSSYYADRQSSCLKNKSC